MKHKKFVTSNVEQNYMAKVIVENMFFAHTKLFVHWQKTIKNVIISH